MHSNELNNMLTREPAFQKYRFSLLTQARLKFRENDTHRYDYGWSGEVLRHKFDLVFTKHFPYELPHFYLYGENNFSRIPHVDSRNFLCVLNSSTTYETNDIKGLIISVLNKVEKILSLDGEDLNDEFLSEFNAYVGHTNNINATLRSEKSFDRMQIFDVKADEKEEEFYMSDTKYMQRSKTHIDQSCILVPSNKPCLPNKLPQTTRDLREYLTVDNIPKKIFNKVKENTLFMFSFIFNGKRILWIAKLYKPDIQKLRSNKKCYNKINRLKNFLNNTNKIDIFTPTRQDIETLVSRANNETIEALKNKTVCIIGMGSIGSFVAEQIVKAGIHNLIIIDDDKIKCENISRHVLNYTVLGDCKTTAMRHYLKNCNIYADIISHSKKWQDCDANIFDNVDLIISVTGDVMSDIYLRNKTDKPILFGFVKPNVLEGHAILTFQSNDLNDMYDLSNEYEIFRHAIFEYGDEIQQDLVCGGYYTTYGINQLMYVNTMIAEMALEYLMRGMECKHRIWVATEDHIASCGKDVKEVKIKGYACGKINEKKS